MFSIIMTTYYILESPKSYLRKPSFKQPSWIFISMSVKILLHLGILLCHICKSQADGQGSYSRLPAINHCREIVVRNYKAERIPSLLMEVSCELGQRSRCGRYSEVSLGYTKKNPRKLLKSLFFIFSACKWLQWSR